MSTRTKKNVAIDMRTERNRQALKIWRKAKGILRGKGPKDVVAWQRRMRKDREILK